MNKIPAPGAAEKAEAASAGLVIQMLVKANRGFSMYLPNNPLHEKFFEEFCGRTKEHLGEFGALRLEIMHDSMLCGGETIYTNPVLRDNLAFRMYADGIRTLKLEAASSRLSCAPSSRSSGVPRRRMTRTTS